MKLRRRIRQVFEVGGLCLACCTIPFLPRAMVMFLSRILGKLAFAMCPRQRRIALANVDLAFADSIPADERRAIACGSFVSFSLLLLDLFWFGSFTGRRIRKYVRFDSSFDQFFATRPMIAVGGHLGNWELLGLALASRGASCLSVAAPLLNSFADSFLNRVRRKTGQEIVSQQGAVRTLLKSLKSEGRVALLLDQNTLPRDGGEFVRFFGLPVPMSRAVTSLAGHTGVPIIVVFCLSDRNGYYTAYALPKLEAQGEGLKGVDLTQAVGGLIEQAIRRDPGQWLWMYRRWNYIPDDHDRTGYPFYARKAGEPRKIF